MKVAAIYTATTPELIAELDAALIGKFSETDVSVVSYQNPDILREARDNGGITTHCTRMLMDLYEKAVGEGADVLLNVCSSVGGPAGLAKPLYEMMGIPFVRIDEDMAMAAVRAGSRIGVLATLPTTLEPTRELVRECARRQEKDVGIVDALAEGAFGLNPARFREKLIDTVRPIADRIDVLVMAQGSMAYAERDVELAIGVPVLSSIRFGVEAVKREVEALRSTRVA